MTRNTIGSEDERTKIKLLETFLGARNSKELISKYPSFTRLAKLTNEEIELIAPNIKSTQLAALRSALQIGAILRYEETEKPKRADSSEEMADCLRDCFRFARDEEFWVLLMDADRNVIGKDRVATGIIDAVSVGPREILGVAIQRRANAIVLAHNHPGGTHVPSMQDMRLTNHLVDIGAALDVEVIDHLVFGTPTDTNPKDYSSFNDIGMIYEPRKPYIPQ